MTRARQCRCRILVLLTGIMFKSGRYAHGTAEGGRAESFEYDVLTSLTVGLIALSSALFLAVLAFETRNSVAHFRQQQQQQQQQQGQQVRPLPASHHLLPLLVVVVVVVVAAAAAAAAAAATCVCDGHPDPGQQQQPPAASAAGLRQLELTMLGEPALGLRSPTGRVPALLPGALHEPSILQPGPSARTAPFNIDGPGDSTRGEQPIAKPSSRAPPPPPPPPPPPRGALLPVRFATEPPAVLRAPPGGGGAAAGIDMDEL